MLITTRILRLGKTLGLFVLFFTIPAASQAQITPDGSLPTSVEQLREIMKINGGERAGNNLFHSFEEFSIPPGTEAIFENALDIQNVFTRITGDSISDIDGILRTQGKANLFLVNPNGIVFGENAQLDIGGSFIATTANIVEFADSTSFSASDSKPILSIDFPIGLGFGSNSGAITVNGTGNQITNSSISSPIELSEELNGLSVSNNQTLALIGNGVIFNDGVISTEGGGIHLNSVNSGSVNIDQTEQGFSLASGNVIEYQDISLNQKSLIDASGEKTGTISLTGKNINLNNTSFLLIRNQGDFSSGSINIRALESITFTGASSDGGIDGSIRTESLNNGKGGDINISANQLSLEDKARILTTTFSNASSGNININVAEQLRSDNASIGSSTFASGDAGNIQLSTSQLELTNDGFITSVTASSGDTGNVEITADEINLVGSSSASTVRTNISAASFNDGNSGDLNIDTKRLYVRDGASIGSSAAAVGSTGSTIINASESINISGSNPNFLGSDTPQSSIRSSVQAASPEGQRILGLPEVPTGNSGNVVLNTSVLNIFQQGTISVQNQGAGEAGILDINANQINLEEAGSITATTASGTGGNIQLNAKNLQIDESSSITATAGNNGNGGNVAINTTSLIAKKNSEVTANAIDGDGGNITIDSDTILGIENSDITANAVGGDGGNITISSDFIVGLEARPELTPLSDITASSDLGIDGTVTISSPENNSDEDIIISAKFVDFYTGQKLFPDGCNNRDGRGMKIAYLNGASPESPDNFFDDDEPLPLPGEESVSDLPEVDSDDQVPPLWSEGDPVIEGNMIQTNSDGSVYFVAVDQEKTAESMVCYKND